MSAKPVRVLLIEDNPAEARLVREQLLGAQNSDAPGVAFQLVVADRLAAGLKQLATQSVDVVLLDLSLPDSQGLETISKARAEAPWAPMVVLTGLDDEALALQAMQSGAQDYLVKGQFDRQPLARAILYAIERHRLQAELNTLALSDPLTGLCNRRGFFALAEQQLKTATRLGQTLLVVFADVDDFKHINDTLGHSGGDQALQETAAVLRETFRASDILGRLGGDEFAVVAITAPNHDSSAVLARLQHNLEARNVPRRGSYRMTLSVGSVLYESKHPASIENLVARADALMYSEKQRKFHLSNAA